jgi:hypothetical protein
VTDGEGEADRKRPNDQRRRRLSDSERKRAIEGLEASFGAWKDRDFDGVEFVDRIRKGLGKRLEVDDSRAP